LGCLAAELGLRAGPELRLVRGPDRLVAHDQRLAVSPGCFPRPVGMLSAADKCRWTGWALPTFPLWRVNQA
jgi:hypothetical protein